MRILGLLKYCDFVMKDDDGEHGYLFDFGKSTSYAGPSPGREREECILVIIPQKNGWDGTRVDQANTSRYDVWRLSWEPSRFLSAPQDFRHS